jgi:hypothetical protein
MDQEFVDYIMKESISEETAEILLSQSITSKEIFLLLKKEHFTKLLTDTGIKVGQHALLLHLWSGNQSIETTTFDNSYTCSSSTYLSSRSSSPHTIGKLAKYGTTTLMFAYVIRVSTTFLS